MPFSAAALHVHHCTGSGRRRRSTSGALIFDTDTSTSAVMRVLDALAAAADDHDVVFFLFLHRAGWCLLDNVVAVVIII